MYEALPAPLFFGLIAASVTTVGLIAVAWRSEWSLRHADLFGLAAAGLLTAMAFLHIVPDALIRTGSAPIWLAAGFFVGLFLHQTIKTVFPEREDSQLPREAITPILAIAVHSFIDGLIYSVTFAASLSAGIYAAIGLILHEFPEGVIAFAILRRHGVSNGKAFFWAFLAAAVTTPLGVLVSSPVVSGLGDQLIGSLFAISAGLILFVATGPLMAPLRDVQPARGLAALSAGVAIALVLLSLPIAGHDHAHFTVETLQTHDHSDHEHSEHSGEHRH